MAQSIIAGGGEVHNPPGTYRQDIAQRRKALATPLTTHGLAAYHLWQRAINLPNTLAQFDSEAGKIAKSSYYICNFNTKQIRCLFFELLMQCPFQFSIPVPVFLGSQIRCRRGRCAHFSPAIHKKSLQYDDILNYTVQHDCGPFQSSELCFSYHKYTFSIAHCIWHFIEL